MTFRLVIVVDDCLVFQATANDPSFLETLDGFPERAVWRRFESKGDSWEEIESFPDTKKLVAENRARELPIPSPEGNGFDHPNDWLEIHE